MELLIKIQKKIDSFIEGMFTFLDGRITGTIFSIIIFACIAIFFCFCIFVYSFYALFKLIWNHTLRELFTVDR